MRIRSLRVANFKGIDERTLEFPETGVVVIEGPNEVGKSSLVEALHLLLGELDSSKKAKIKESQPVGRDVGPEVEAEIESGKYRFVYFKRFLKKPETVLRILAPERHDLTGRTAHERVNAILDESMDPVLWQALQVTQSDPLTQASLADATKSLGAALDRSAGQEVAGDRESTLFDRVETEYLRYYTATGRAGKTQQDAETRESDAATALEDTAARLQQLEEDIGAVESLEKRTDELEVLHGKQLAALTQRQKEHEELRTQATKLEALAFQSNALTASETATRNAHQARLKRIDAANEVQRRCSSLEAEAAQHAPDLLEAEKAAHTTTGALERANSAATDARRIAELRDRDKNHLHYERDLHEMRDRRKAIDEDRERRAKAEAGIEATRVDEAMAKRIRQAHDELQRAEAQAQTRSPQLLLRARRDLSIEIDGEKQELSADERLERTVSERLQLSIDGILELELRGGAGTRELQDAIQERQAALDKLFDEAQVGSLEEAEAALRARAEARLVIEQCNRQITKNLPDLTYEGLVDLIGRVEAAGKRYLADRPSEPPIAPNYDAAKPANREARVAAAAADAELSDARMKADAAREKHSAIKERTDRSRIEIQLAQRDLQKEIALLAQERHAKADEGLVREFEEATVKATAARETVAKAQQMLGTGRLQEAQQLANNAEKAAARTEQDRVAVRDDLNATRTRIEVRGGEGLFEAEQNARTLLERAKHDRQALFARAAAAKLLHDTMAEEKAAARRAYEAPLREKIAQLGRLVYHESFAVELDKDLAIRQRTLRGQTIPFESLSVGAREQLGLITRLAAALLVDEEQGVPVVLDDTLGSTDPERLEGLGAMLSVAGQRAQIIVLTCTPDRFRHIGDATIIRL